MKNYFTLLLAFTLILGSCTNYDDQFSNLETQIAGLRTQVGGLSSVTSSISALQGTVSSLQSSMAALPQSSDVSALSAGLSAANDQIAAIEASIAALVTSVANGTSTSDATAAAVAALATDVEAVQASVNTLLTNSDVFSGDLVISTEGELAVAELITASKLAIINGDVYIEINKTNKLDAAKVSAITKNIKTVVGNVAVNATSSVDFSALTSVSGDYIVVESDIADAALLTVGNAYLDYDGAISASLKSAGNIVLGVSSGTTSINFSSVTVNTSFKTADAITASYSGGAISHTITGDSATLDLGASTSVILGSGIGVSAIAATTTATTITLNGTAAASLSIDAKNAALTIGAKELGASTIVAKTFAGAAVAQATGDLSITADTVDLSALVSATNITLSTDGAVTLAALTNATALTVSGTGALTADKLAGGTIDAASAASVSLAKHVEGTVSAPKATSIILGSIATADLLDASVATSLNLKAQVVAFEANDTTAPVLESLTVKGAEGSSVVVGSTVALTTVSLDGVIDSVSISGAKKLTSLTTAGKIGSFTLNDNDALASATLGHKEVSATEGSTVIVTGNKVLASLTTATDYMRTLTVSGNAALASVNLASFKNAVASGDVAMTLKSNALTGVFTAAVTSTVNGAVAVTTEAIIKSADLATAKDYVKKVAATASVTLVLDINLSEVTGSTPTDTTTSTLAAAMHADTASVVIVSASATTNLDSAAEYDLVVP